MTDKRFERKFVGGMDQVSFALAWLEHVCAPADSYADEVIHSIYYDTPRLQCYYEKVNGDFLKTKVRLRWYEEEEDGSGEVYLEVKRKTGGSRGKTRARLDVDRPWLISAELCDPAFVDLLRAQADVCELGPVGLAPSLHIGYRRRRFACPASGAGVAIDTDIGVRRINGGLIPGIGCATIPSIVLEVKGDRRGDIPWIGRLYDAGFRSRSFSKYGECVSRLIGEEA